MDASGAGRRNRSSPSCRNRSAQRIDFFHGLIGGTEGEAYEMVGAVHLVLAGGDGWVYSARLSSVSPKDGHAQLAPSGAADSWRPRRMAWSDATRSFDRVTRRIAGTQGLALMVPTAEPRVSQRTGEAGASGDVLGPEPLWGGSLTMERGNRHHEPKFLCGRGHIRDNSRAGRHFVLEREPRPKSGSSVVRRRFTDHFNGRRGRPVRRLWRPILASCCCS